MAKLTPRQRDVLTLRAQGLSNQQIAHKLCLSNQTVNNHFHTIYNRLELEHRTPFMAIMKAIRTGQITLG